MINQDNPKQGANVIDFYKNDYIKSTRGKHPIPAVIRLVEYQARTKKRIPFSKKNIFIRDQLTCQYCGEVFPHNELTFDHVIPRYEWKKKGYRGTPTTWSNIVAACVPCNRKKANMSLKDSGMKILRTPTEPSPYQFVLGVTPWRKIPKEWMPYLPPLYKELIEKCKKGV